MLLRIFAPVCRNEILNLDVRTFLGAFSSSSSNNGIYSRLKKKTELESHPFVSTLWNSLQSTEFIHSLNLRGGTKPLSPTTIFEDNYLDIISYISYGN